MVEGTAENGLSNDRYVTLLKTIPFSENLIADCKEF